jgi:hypothetical protein
MDELDDVPQTSVGGQRVLVPGARGAGAPRDTAATEFTSGAAYDEAPPIGRSWAALYLIVVVNLALWIAVFAVFTRAFR